MTKSLVAALFLVAVAAGCAEKAQPPAVQPSNHQGLPLPPVKPEAPRATTQQSVFTDWQQITRYL